MDKAERAFKWIYDRLSELHIPCMVGGGLAVRLYGGSRPLYDIDLDIPEKRFADLLPSVSKYIVSGPERFRDELFDVFLLTLDYKGQLIDITGAESIRVFDKAAGVWRQDPTNFEAVSIRQVYGVSAKVQRADLLLRYKRWLARPTDLEDIQVLERFLQAEKQ